MKQIQTFGQGVIHIFCEHASDSLSEKYDSYQVEILAEIKKSNDIIGVLITYYDIVSRLEFSKKGSEKTYKKTTKFITNPNFKLNFPL